MTLADQIAQAKAALHSLLIGQMARVVVDQNGERVEFTSANAGRLAAWIGELQRQIDNGKPINVVRFSTSKFGD